MNPVVVALAADKPRRGRQNSDCSVAHLSRGFDYLCFLLWTHLSDFDVMNNYPGTYM